MVRLRLFLTLRAACVSKRANPSRACPERSRGNSNGAATHGDIGVYTIRKNGLEHFARCCKSSGEAPKGRKILAHGASRGKAKGSQDKPRRGERHSVYRNKRNALAQYPNRSGTFIPYRSTVIPSHVPSVVEGRARDLLFLLVVVVFAVAASAAERLVSPGELEIALAEARPGDTLRLSAGVHPGPITVSKPVHLIGNPGAVLEGNGQGSALILSSDDVRVSNLKVRGSGADLSQDDAVILLYDVRNATVEQCEVEARAFGIYIRGGGNNRVIGNVVRGDPSLERSRRGNGIHLWKTRNNEILNNKVESVRDGLYFSFAHDNQIRGNEGSRLRYGIHYMYSERNTLIGNRFSDSIGGITLMFSRGNRVEENLVVRNRDFGILGLFLERSVLIRNQVAENGRGLFVEDSHRNQFSANRVQRNGVGAYITAGSEANVFSSNRFEGNLVQVYHGHAGVNAWSQAGRGNFWGDYSGFDWNGDGIGDTPYRLQTTASALMARYPVARWFWMTPIVALLDWWDSLLAKSTSSLFDPAPLIRPTEQTDQLAESAFGSL